MKFNLTSFQPHVFITSFHREQPCARWYLPGIARSLAPPADLDAIRWKSAVVRHMA